MNWDNVAHFFWASWQNVQTTVGLFWENILGGASLIGIIDAVLVFSVLWWIYRKFRRSDLIRIFPRLFLILLTILIARMLGLFALFYVSLFLLVIVLLAIAVLYAQEIKTVLEVPILQPVKSPERIVQHQLSSSVLSQIVIEAVAVLARAQKPALIIIRRKKPLTKLADNGTKMHSDLTSGLLIDLFSGGTGLSRGAAIIDNGKIIAAGSTLFKPKAKVLFNDADKSIRKAAKEFDAIVLVMNKPIEGISVISGEDVYKKLAPQDLKRVLGSILG